MTEERERKHPPREDLCRSVEFKQADAPTDGLTLEGYGAVFNAPTEIDSWEGRFTEVIAPGAFKKSLRERTPRMQFDHGTHPMIGSLPIGTITEISEDERGLYVQGRLHDNWLMEPVRDAIRDGSVDGMSFRFSVVRDEWTGEDGKKLAAEEVSDALYYGGRGKLTRTLKEVKISEVGPVVWPAYEATSVSVRSRGPVIIDPAKLHEQGTRKRLAELVLLADADEARHSVDEPQTPHPANRDETEDVTDAPTPTDETAEGHESEQEDTPQTTDTASAGEHESDQAETNPPAQDAIDESTERARRREQLAILEEMRAALETRLI